MDVIIRNISLYFRENLDDIDKGHIIINRGKIKRVGSGDYEGGYDYPIYEGEGILACPGFINAHTHIGDSFGKDISVDSNFESRIHPVHGIKNKILQKSDREHLIQFMRTSAISMMKNGIVLFADFREGGLEGINRIKEAISGLSIKSIILGRPEYYYEISQDFDENPKIPTDVLKLIHK